MDFDILILLYPALFILPIVLYYASVQPGFGKTAWPVYLAGGAMVVSAFLPLAGMSHMNYLVLWIAVTGVLLLASAVAWMYGAIKDKGEFAAGPIMTAVTVAASGAIIGNWLSVILSVLFLAVFIRYQRKTFFT